MSVGNEHPLEPPELTSDYSLNADQIDQYQRDGHVLLRQVADPDEVAAYRPVIADATERFKRETRSLDERDTYGKAFLQVWNLWEQDSAVARFTLARRFAKIAAELMGVTGVRIYHDQALFKEPGGGHTPWHQDQYYWPLDTDKTVTMWMPMVDVPVEMGALTFATGSHRQGRFGQLAISDESEQFFADLVKERGFGISHEPLAAGDATFHAGWTLHCAPGNNTDRMREVMTVIYHAEDARVIEPDSHKRQCDLARWLPGLKPGDLAASRLNPLAYSSRPA